MSLAELRPAVAPDNIPTADELIIRARALAQPGRQRTSADDEFVGSRNIVRRDGRSQFG